jgi:hypothetical protein
MTRKRTLLSEARELLTEARGGRAAGGDDPQLADTLPLAVRLAVIAAQERAVRERGTEGLAEGDLPATTWAILREWEAAGPKLNRALRAARRKAGIPPATPHSARVPDLPLPAEVVALMNDWSERAGDAS